MASKLISPKNLLKQIPNLVPKNPKSAVTNPMASAGLSLVDPSIPSLPGPKKNSRGQIKRFSKIRMKLGGK